MTKKLPPEWTQFQVGPNINNVDCSPLVTVSHVAHIETALRIIAEGRIRAGLVFDESKLNEERILVTWLSPNDWVYGFRYGNVRFTFEWERLIQNAQYFWVESIAYRTPACRILVTHKDYGRELQVYDPRRRDGPWWCDTASNKHYWNGRYCLELVLERNLNLSESCRTDFVTHHPDMCSMDAPCNVHLRYDAGQASALFLGSLVARGISPESLGPTEINRRSVIPGTLLRTAWEHLKEQLSLTQTRYRGDIAPNHKVAISVARAILNAYARSDQEEVARLAGLFTSKDSMLSSCAKVVAKHFGVTDWHTLS